MELKSNAPEIKWIIQHAPVNDFARNLDSYLLRTGTLTDNMLAAVRRNLSAAHVDAAGVERIVTAFNHALESGLKQPKMYLGDFTFKLATRGTNKGAIFVTEGGAYLGKVAGGKFLSTRDCTDEQRADVLKVCADPKAAAEAYGKETGRCSCCGLELTNEESIALSIGPICRERYGF
jgi:hypothetical protein